ncbi:MAG: DUF4878 domain-containing protein [Bacteroidetes bacterium]|nr:MAG: DUF4878 domain-containing protein [Bacteroidota bacterium]
MRSIKVLFLAIATVFMFHACKTTDRPEKVTEDFMYHLLAGEFEKAAELGTESTKQMMEMFKALESLGGEEMVDDTFTPERIKDIECEVDGDNAICRFEEDGEMSEVNLVRVDGKWLVDMKKEDPFGDFDMDWDEEEEWDMEDIEEIELD